MRPTCVELGGIDPLHDVRVVASRRPVSVKALVVGLRPSVSLPSRLVSFGFVRDQGVTTVCEIDAPRYVHGEAP